MGGVTNPIHPEGASMAATPTFSLTEGQFLEGTPYRIVRAIDSGGMGEVYEVDHTRAGTRRAIKVVRDLSDPRAQAADRLRQEGLALRAVDHPSVVRVFEVGVLHDGRPFVAMELLQGLTIRALLHHHVALGVARAASLTLQALDGLQAVHDAGLVHRDVKPTNLLVCSGDRLKLLDFGVAKWVRGQPVVKTATGQVLGTARYMAPEQLRGKPVDGRADQYAAALVFFEAATGMHPFQLASGPTGSVVARLVRPAPRLSDVCAEPVDSALDAVVSRALSVDPNDRFPSVRAFARALREATAEVRDRSPVDPHATTRLQSVAVTWSKPERPASSLDHSATAPHDRQSDGPCSPTSATRPVGRAIPSRLQALGLATSLCALLLGLTAACVAIWGQARRDAPPTCSSCSTCLGHSR